MFDRAVEVAVRYAEALEQRAFGLGPGPSAALRVQHQFFERAVYGRVRDAFGGGCGTRCRAGPRWSGGWGCSSRVRV